jgi:hypothetical protein
MSKLLYGASLLLTATGLHAAGYCSLNVKLQSPSGKEVEARVVVEEQNGFKTEQTAHRGSVKFCGLGINTVSVTVGDAACNQVVVRNVPLNWNETRNLVVTYDEAPCLIDAPPVAACSFLLRFITTNHDPIEAVSFKAERPFVESHRADEYGRVFVRIAAGQELAGIGSASGYKPVQINIPCISKNQRLEQMVLLEKIGQ